MSAGNVGSDTLTPQRHHAGWPTWTEPGSTVAIVRDHKTVSFAKVERRTPTQLVLEGDPRPRWTLASLQEGRFRRARRVTGNAWSTAVEDLYPPDDPEVARARCNCWLAEAAS